MIRVAMDALYAMCVMVAGTALVLVAAVIPWAVFTRYVLNEASSWPEPAAVYLTIVVTFIGAAACYRRGQHMNVGFFVSLLPGTLQRVVNVAAELLVAALALLMIGYGAKLVQATWNNSISEFPSVPVGLTYLPIPLGGAALLLFVMERLAIGRPPVVGQVSHH